jgi:UDP-N-acetylglucosamine:LPS N-acetylglucosamine transferase
MARIATALAEGVAVETPPAPAAEQVARKLRLAEEASSAGGREHILLVASSGGHLAQLIALRPWWQDKRRTWVTFDTADARSQMEGEDVIFARHPTTRNVPNLLRNSIIAAGLMRRATPTLVVSTGAAVAFPFFVYAKAMGVPSVYLEVFDRVDSRTLTGRLCHPLATEFLVQWERQLKLYNGARVIGTLL